MNAESRYTVTVKTLLVFLVSHGSLTEGVKSGVC